VFATVPGLARLPAFVGHKFSMVLDLTFCRIPVAPRPHSSQCHLLSVLFLLLNVANVTAGPKHTKNVLLLYGSEKDLPMNLLIDRLLRVNFREEMGDGAELYSEYVDRNRFPDKRNDRRFLDLLHDRHIAHGLDLIVVVESSALDLVQSHRDWFFPTTPVVFCCVTEAEYKTRTISPGVTGIPARLDYAPTLDVALKLHPGMRQVAVIAGVSVGDKSALNDALREFQPFRDKVAIRELVGLNTGELRQEVSQLSRDTIIIYLSITQDRDGTFYTPRDALDQFADAASVPVYAYFDTWLGHGIVGGYVASFEKEAANAARLGMLALATEKSEHLPAKNVASCAYMFDWRQLKRWGIDEAALPPGSVVRFREPSLWDLYRWHIVGIVSLCVIQTALILGFLIQRTSRRRAEREIRQGEERFRMVVESAPNTVVVVDSGERILLVNSQCEKSFGYRREELIGQSAEVLVPERFRADQSFRSVKSFASSSIPPAGKTHQLWGRRKDGIEFPIEIRLSPRQTGEGSLVLCVMVDITARKQAEEARQELAHASRLTLVGELTASIAHEINQPLGAILSNADAAEMLLDLSPPSLDQVRAILSDIRRDDLRASEVIRRLRVFLKRREIEKQPVDLNEVSSDVLRLVQGESRRRGVVVESAPAGDLPTIYGDKIHLQQVLLNLVFNSMEAMADMQGEKRIIVHSTWDKNGTAEVAVSDTGPGIPLNRHARLFDPFFSTKKDGMGLGLSIVRTLIEAHGGTIWAENNSVGGATFRFRLPVSHEEATPESRDTRQVPVGAGT
jgi:PAS domain S-box-containing protein